MKKTFKIALLRIFFVFLILFAAPLFDVDATYEDLFTYEISGNKCKIVSCDIFASGKVIIPDTINGAVVTSVGNSAFKNCSGISDIVLPETIEQIGDDAFNNCKNLVSINLPDSIASIGDSAFFKCVNLKEIVISKSVTIIPENAFYMCEKLKSADLPSGVKEIRKGAFKGCKSLDRVVLPEKLTEICDSGFSGCLSLESIYLSSEIKNIGTDAFAECTALETVFYSGSSDLSEEFYVYSGNDELNNATWIFEHKHTALEGFRIVEATCTTDGYSELVCTCGFSERYDFVPSKGHNLSSFTVLVEPDCKNNGVMKMSCSGCDYYDLMTLPASSHKIIIDEAVPETCFENGKTEGSHCSVCGEVFISQDVLPALGHDYSEKIYDAEHLVSAATYTKGAVYRYSCVRCSAVSEKTHMGEKLILGKPKDIISASTENSITLRWSKVKDATGYGLYYYKPAEKKWKLYRKVSTNEFTFSSLPAGNVYSFAVRAYVVEDGKIIASPYYQIITEATRPAKPAKIAAVQNEKAIKVSWTPVKGATGYRVYGYNAKIQNWVVVRSSTKICSNITDNLKSGTYYKFAVRPYIDLGVKIVWCESYAEIISATKPLAPRMKATSLAGAIRFEWDAVGGADGYLIYGSSKPDSGFVRLKATKSLSATISGLKRNQTYYFKIYSAKKLYSSYVYSYASGIKAVKTR